MLDRNTTLQTVQEYSSLLNKIENRIKTLAQHQREKITTNIAIVESLNRLKYHRKKVKMTLNLIKNAKTNLAGKIRLKVRSTFNRANNELMTVHPNINL